MPRQNIYDNEAFFQRVLNSRGDPVNFNDCIETPILLSMLPDPRGKSILDIGCGMGQHARQYADMGAGSILGIDISEKMLAYARAHNGGDNIAYLRMAMEDIDAIEGRFDLVTSSLAFDYAEDFEKLARDVYALIKDGGSFVFSMSHPMVTAWDGAYDRYTRTPQGERLYANVRNYCLEGLRKVDWVVSGYVCNFTALRIDPDLVRADLDGIDGSVLRHFIAFSHRGDEIPIRIRFDETLKDIEKDLTLGSRCGSMRIQTLIQVL